ncbi:MAG: helix-turn-helix domain-containing protein [Spirochaetia bacterium]|nr:helix-turn-helix domain-containing protein [Spirochaetia bacterium]
MRIKPIHTENDYQETLSRIEELMDATAQTPEMDELEVLSILVEKYEDIHYPVGFAEPVEAIKYKMETLGWTPSDLARLIGDKGRVSDILNRKRRLSLSMIRKISAAMEISAETLVREYPLAG